MALYSLDAVRSSQTSTASNYNEIVLGTFKLTGGTLDFGSERSIVDELDLLAEIQTTSWLNKGVAIDFSFLNEESDDFYDGEFLAIDTFIKDNPFITHIDIHGEGAPLHELINFTDLMLISNPHIYFSTTVDELTTYSQHLRSLRPGLIRRWSVRSPTTVTAMKNMGMPLERVLVPSTPSRTCSFCKIENVEAAMVRSKGLHELRAKRSETARSVEAVEAEAAAPVEASAVEAAAPVEAVEAEAVEAGVVERSSSLSPRLLRIINEVLSDGC